MLNIAIRDRDDNGDRPFPYSFVQFISMVIHWWIYILDSKKNYTTTKKWHDKKQSMKTWTTFGQWIDIEHHYCSLPPLPIHLDTIRKYTCETLSYFFHKIIFLVEKVSRLDTHTGRQDDIYHHNFVLVLIGV